MNFTHTLTSNWQNAFRGLRNPMNSWGKSDSYGGIYITYKNAGKDAVDFWRKKAYPTLETDSIEWENVTDEFYKWFDNNAIINKNEHEDVAEMFFIGPNDMDLAQRMIAAGSPNDKFLRQIFVSVDITAPLYW